MPYTSRRCEVCSGNFTPPHRANNLSLDDNHLRLCAKCRRAAKDAKFLEPPQNEMPSPHWGAAPMKQVVFDLETWGLDRGWGVTMVASFLIHGDGGKPIRKTLTLREYKAWKAGIRSNDRAFVEDIFKILRDCHIMYAHNGERFDVRWLRSVALKYGLDMPRLRLVDPCAVAWRSYRLGRNSLEAVADFLELPQSKIHIPADVWRQALLDNDDAAWKLLVERCESDVDILNMISRRVTGDLGMIDFSGSARR